MVKDQEFRRKLTLLDIELSEMSSSGSDFMQNKLNNKIDNKVYRKKITLDELTKAVFKENTQYKKSGPNLNSSFKNTNVNIFKKSKKM